MTHIPSRSHLLRHLALLAIATSTIGCGSKTPPATTADVTVGQPPTPPVTAEPGQPLTPPALQQPAQQPAAPSVAQQPATAPAPATTDATTDAKNMAPEIGYLTAQSVDAKINVRSAPNISASTPHYGIPGDAVTLEQYASGADGYVWYNVRFNTSGVTGWVRGDFVTMEGAIASAPAANAPVTGSGIVQNIQFAPGASSATMYGSVVRGTQDTYYVSASPGQYMQVDASSPEGNAVFQIYGEVEGTWTPLLGANPGDDTTTWGDTLPGGGTGKFMIVLGSSRGNTNYSLYVGIQ